MLGIIAFLAGFNRRIIMRFISRRNPISAVSLKRREIGTIVRHHNGNWEDIEFTRVHGGWKRERTDFVGIRAEVVSSAAVAAECNHAYGYKESWAMIY